MRSHQVGRQKHSAKYLHRTCQNSIQTLSGDLGDVLHTMKFTGGCEQDLAVLGVLQQHSIAGMHAVQLIDGTPQGSKCAGRQAASPGEETQKGGHLKGLVDGGPVSRQQVEAGHCIETCIGAHAVGTVGSFRHTFATWMLTCLG